MNLRGAEGASLLEVLVSVLLVGIGLLAVAPLFISASRGNAIGGDLGEVGAVAVEQLELLRARDYEDLIAGGSLNSDVDGFFDGSFDGMTVRWAVAENSVPADTKTVTVEVRRTSELITGPRTEITLTTLRGR